MRPEDIKTVRFARGVARWDGLPDDGRPEIAFVGRSNVGKSSLVNYLVGRRALARTSNQPGKTRELNFYAVNEGRPDGPVEGFYLVDLPGYGYAKISKAERARWAGLMGRYLTERERLRAVFVLIDGRHGPTKLDEELLLTLKGGPVPYVAVLTKGDKLSGNERQKIAAQTRRRLAELGIEIPVLMTSAEKKQGAEQVWEWAGTLLELA